MKGMRVTREPRSRSALREDQVFIVDTIKEKDGCMIVLGMGGGKTASTLTAMKDLLEDGSIERWLVIAPLRVARDTWPDEIQDWLHLQDIDYAVAVGAPAARQYALQKKAKVTITNRENLVWLSKELGSVENWPWDGLIIDESSMFKAGKKRTTKSKTKRKDGTFVVNKGGKMTSFGVLTAARKKVKKIVELTGTPGELIDLWGQFYLIDRGERLGATREDYIARWFDYNQYSREIKPRSYAHDDIMERLKDVMISLPPRQLVEPPVHIPVKVQLDAETMKEYNRFRRTLVSDLHDVEAVNAGVLTNKLLQFSSGSCYREDRSIATVHTAKLDALDDLIEQANGEPVLIFYGFQHSLAEILKRHPDAVVFNQCDTAIKDWNEGRIKKLLMHPKSGGHGTNLQYGGHIAIWFDLTWSLELYLQANARLPRPGQKNIVAIYKILAEGTVDERVVSALDNKETNQRAIIEAVEAEIVADFDFNSLWD
jgi:SNF2-related domain